MASPSLILTERQALVALAQILQGIDTDADDVSLLSAFAAVLAVIAGGLVVGQQALYTEGTVAAVTLTPSGQLRVATADPQVAWFGADPFAGSVAWEG